MEHRQFSGTPADPRGAPKRIALLTLCLSVLLAQLDTSVVNLGLKEIGRELNARVDTLQWVLDSYNLLYAVLLLTGGLLADLYGRRLVFIAGTCLFTAGSVICFAAPSALVLICGRAVAGVGAALLAPSSLALLRVMWPAGDERKKALGLFAACNGLAFVIGPSLGGLFIESFGWRSIFLIVVPFGVALLALVYPTIPESSDPAERRFDLAGQCLSILCLGAFVYGVIELRSSFTGAAAVFAVMVIALATFIRVEKSLGSAALVPLDLFAVPEFRGAAAATTGMTFGMYGILFLLPLSWQASGRLGALGAGAALVPMALLFVVISPFSGALSARFGDRMAATFGLMTIATGVAVLALTADAASVLPTEIGLCLTGAGMGVATGPLMGAAVGSVDSARSGTAAALINVARMVGATAGVALLGTLFAFGGKDGFLISLLCGSAVQFFCAAVAWWNMGRGASEASVRPAKRTVRHPVSSRR